MVDNNAVFCTLFDSKYIDKGLALYESLLKVADDFILYIFAFDQLAYDILIDLKLSNAVIISLEEFETEEMLSVKEERSPAEYCWTCTPITIEYVLERFKEKQCTYLDADLYFFNSPYILLDEIRDSNKSVIITEHRFPEDKMEEGLKESGKYCVQFNTFLNDEQGLTVLKWWKDRCLEWCFYTKEGEKKGDQKYLENWPYKFEGIHELQNLGGGVAPWNVSQYQLKDKKNLILGYKEKEFKLVFYHFQNIRYLPFGFVNIKSQTKDVSVKQSIYIPYLVHVENIREKLKKKYGLRFSIKKGYYNNPMLRFIQNYIMPFKVERISDIISLRKMRNYK